MEMEKPEGMEQLTHELIQMGEKDWEIRRIRQNPATREQITREEFERVDRENTLRLKEIVKQIGWPTISKVGEDASYVAWLLVQHADLDVEFQEACLILMKEAYEAGDVLPANVANLTDRVAVNRGQEQVYGTQWYQDEQGVPIPKPIKDQEELDKRRENMGLEPFAIASQKMRGDYQYSEKDQHPKIRKIPKATK